MRKSAEKPGPPAKPARLHPDAYPDPEALAASILAMAETDPVLLARRALDAYRAKPEGKHAPALADALEATLQRAAMMTDRALRAEQLAAVKVHTPGAPGTGRRRGAV